MLENLLAVKSVKLFIGQIAIGQHTSSRSVALSLIPIKRLLMQVTNLARRAGHDQSVEFRTEVFSLQY